MIFIPEAFYGRHFAEATAKAPNNAMERLAHLVLV